MGETMFEKERPKKELTKKQLTALAKGRAKMKAKRDGTYEEQLIEEKEVRNVEAIKVRQREQRLDRQKVLDEKKEIDIYNKLMKKGNDKINKFKEMKYKWLDKAPSMKEYTQFKNILDNITEDDVLNDYHIDMLNDSMGAFVSIVDEVEDDTQDGDVIADLDNVVDI
tara:strand:+ start:50 stop:550 length:501 start_codon:yes stop_codon:yes gene_type:complete